MQKISMPLVGDEFELEVCDLNIDGSAVARESGLVFFIDAGLPGERLRARVESVKKNLVMARRLSVLSRSPGEVRPFCPHFGDCGGCAWQDLDYAAQLLWKHRRVESALWRIAGVKAVLPPVLPSPRLQGFRNKMEYAFGPSLNAVGSAAARGADGAGAGGAAAGASDTRRLRTDDAGLALGLRRRSSRGVCPLERCPLQSEGSGAVLRVVRDWALRHDLAPWDGKGGALRHLILRECAPGARGDDPERMAELVCGAEPAPSALAGELYAELEPLGVSSFTLSQRRDKSQLASGERVLRRFGKESVAERIGPLVMEFTAQSFVQTNAAAAALLYDQARQLADARGGERVWDIYSGVGALGLYLADAVKSVIGVELSGEACKMAGKNAAALGFKHCEFVRGDAAKVLPALSGRPDILCLDPPRGGISGQLAPVIKHKCPSRIIYVSCDPATLARDIAALAPMYALAEIRAVDMFPHTPHVECVARLEIV